MIQITSTAISMGMRCRGGFIVDNDGILLRGLRFILVAEGFDIDFQ